MACTLIINPGSSSKKYSFFSEGKLVFSVQYERQEDMIEVCTIEASGTRQKCEFVSEAVYKNTLTDTLKRATAFNVLASVKDIVAVGVRLVVPGSCYQQHQIITPEIVTQLRERETSAPLHIPPTLYEIEQVMIELPHVILVGVSDSAFHKSIPAERRRYSLPAADVEKFDIARFGYHGISVSSVARKLPRVIGLRSRVIVCHIGSGMSLTALHDGESVDTTMGYSPLSGLVMGTRSGDIDPGALLEFMRAKQLSVSEVYRYLSTECGLKGISGYSDIRTLLQRASAGNDTAEFALTLLKNRFQKQLLGVMSTLGGADAIVFAGTAAERSSELRTRLLTGLDWVNIVFDKNRNDELIGGNGVISDPDAPITVAVVKTNEEAEMVRVVQTFIRTT